MRRAVQVLWPISAVDGRYNPENPKRVLQAVLGSSPARMWLMQPRSSRLPQASIPAKLLAEHFEDWHDILEARRDENCDNYLQFFMFFVLLGRGLCERRWHPSRRGG